MATRIDGNVSISGTLTADQNQSPTARTYIEQEDDVVYPVPLSDLRVWDAPGSHLPAAAANDDHGLDHSAMNAAETVKGVDAGGTTETQYSRADVPVPAEYVAGESITVRINASMAVVADDSATLDLEAYREAAPTVDICATAAQSINSATPADKDYTITPSTVVVGDVLKLRLKTAVTDAGDADDDILAQIHSVDVLFDVKG